MRCKTPTVRFVFVLDRREENCVRLSEEEAAAARKGTAQATEVPVRTTAWPTVQAILRFLSSTALGISCAGCFGFLVDKPMTTDIQNPAPRNAAFVTSAKQDRWACQSAQDPPAPSTKDRFLVAWGAPREKVTTSKGETWIYEEQGRWCGLWIAFFVPIPVLLPVCETFDRVDFEGDLAVRSESRRPQGFGVVLNLLYIPHTPLFVGVSPGEATDLGPQVFTESSRSPGRGRHACF